MRAANSFQPLESNDVETGIPVQAAVMPVVVPQSLYARPTYLSGVSIFFLAFAALVSAILVIAQPVNFIVLVILYSAPVRLACSDLCIALFAFVSVQTIDIVSRQPNLVPNSRAGSCRVPVVVATMEGILRS